MKKTINVAIIGLDTSHSVEFPKLLQAPEVPEGERVQGLQALSCLSFETPFQNKEGLAKRRAQLEAWGVKVTESFEEALDGAEAILLEINDPSLHLEYFKRVATLGKRVFVDKPLSANRAEAKEMLAIAKATGVETMSCSSLRYMAELDAALSKIQKPERGTFFGPLGKAPAGSSIVWYGVHTVEMLVKALGLGAKSVSCVKCGADGALIQVSYEDKRHGLAELVEGAYAYGGSVRAGGNGVSFSGGASYKALLLKIEEFLRSGRTEATFSQAYEIISILDAAERSLKSGREEEV